VNGVRKRHLGRATLRFCAGAHLVLAVKTDQRRQGADGAGDEREGPAAAHAGCAGGRGRGGGAPHVDVALRRIAASGRLAAASVLGRRRPGPVLFHPARREKAGKTSLFSCRHPLRLGIGATHLCRFLGEHHRVGIARNDRAKRQELLEADQRRLRDVDVRQEWVVLRCLWSARRLTARWKCPCPVSRQGVHIPPATRPLPYGSRRCGWSTSPSPRSTPQTKSCSSARQTEQARCSCTTTSSVWARTQSRSGKHLRLGRGTGMCTTTGVTNLGLHSVPDAAAALIRPEQVHARRLCCRLFERPLWANGLDLTRGSAQTHRGNLPTFSA